MREYAVVRHDMLDSFAPFDVCRSFCPSLVDAMRDRIAGSDYPREFFDIFEITRDARNSVVAVRKMRESEIVTTVKNQLFREFLGELKDGKVGGITRARVTLDDEPEEAVLLDVDEPDDLELIEDEYEE